jgi:histidyl-tRNA synthetase
MEKFRAVRGMKDWYGHEAEKYRHVIEKSIEVGERYGYGVMETPILEYTEVFHRSIGDETDVVSKEMYTFIDRGGESLTLRPEGTAGIVRAVVAEGLCQNLPQKLMYYGPMFRYDRPQKGRFRQFHQVGFEHIGSKTPYADVSMIALCSDILNRIGIFDFRICINTLGDNETKKTYTNAIVKYFSRHESKLSEESQRRLHKNPLRILDSKNPTDREIGFMAPRVTDYLSKEAGIFFEKVCALMTQYCLCFELDQFLVRGLDYYCHTTFEIKMAGEHEDIGSIGGGGRYDNLVAEMGGPNVSGVGFALGVERLMEVIGKCKIPPRNTFKIAVVPVGDLDKDVCFGIVRELHNNGISAEFTEGSDIGKRMRMADKLNCDVAYIVGENERANKTITVKFLREIDECLKNTTINMDAATKFARYRAEGFRHHWIP